MKKIFLSFASSDLYPSLRRINRQAKEMCFFDKIICADQRQIDESFLANFDDIMILGSRGFGYWCWKPQIIKQTLNTIDEGDVILYCDVGCHLNPKGRIRLKQYFDMAQISSNGIVSFKLERFPEYHWTKGDLLDFFGVRTNIIITHEGQISATAILVKKCCEAELFIEEWLKIYEIDLHLVDDTPSISDNFLGFKEHRHDQSVFSLLCKMRGSKVLSAKELGELNESRSEKWSALAAFPIHARRDKRKKYLLRKKEKFKKSFMGNYKNKYD